MSESSVSAAPQDCGFIKQRDHTFEHSVRVHQVKRDWYAEMRYKVIEIPKDSKEVRAEFILKNN